MAVFNLVMACTVPATPVFRRFTSSPQLMRILRENDFCELRTTTHHLEKKTGYFQKNGKCTVCLLPDSRVHVLNAPVAPWSLHDFLTSEELRILIAFAGMDEQAQESMSLYMAPKCGEYNDVILQLPLENLTWKQEFLLAYNTVKGL